MLYCIRDVKQRVLCDDGDAVRVYVPLGTQWYGYVVQRTSGPLTFFLGALAERGPQESRPPGRREFR